MNSMAPLAVEFYKRVTRTDGLGKDVTLNTSFFNFTDFVLSCLNVELASTRRTSLPVTLIAFF
jgi:hypothetical protein